MPVLAHQAEREETVTQPARPEWYLRFSPAGAGGHLSCSIRIFCGQRRFSQWNSRDAPRMGASLAFYSVLSLAPLVILIVGVRALVFGRAQAQLCVAAR